MKREDVENLRAVLDERKRNGVKCCVVLGREVYDKNWKPEYLPIFRCETVGIVEEHEDWYVHGTTAENLERILAEKVIRVGREETTIGSAVYTYPVKAGHFFSPTEGLKYIVFRTSQKHIHLVENEEGLNTTLGEADFLEDVPLTEFKVMSEEEVRQLVEAKWNSGTAGWHYYGRKNMPAGLSMDALPEWLTLEDSRPFEDSEPMEEDSLVAWLTEQFTNERRAEATTEQWGSENTEVLTFDYCWGEEKLTIWINREQHLTRVHFVTKDGKVLSEIYYKTRQPDMESF